MLHVDKTNFQLCDISQNPGGENPFKCQHNTCIQLNLYSNEIIFLYIHFKEQLIYMFLLELRVK